MRALVYTYGDGQKGPATAELQDVAPPVQTKDRVLIRVTRAGVNSADVAALRGGVNVFAAERVGGIGRTFIPGGEVVGVRADTGARVAAICDAGGYAEWVSASRDRVYDLPDDVDDATALAFLVSGLTASFMLRPAARLAPGESIAIAGAAGGLGSIAVQLAKNYGAGNVIGLASSAEKQEIVRQLGADVAVSSNVAGLSERIKEADSGGAIDVATDMAGGETFEQLFGALAPFGRVITYGSGGGEAPSFETRRLIVGSRSVTGVWLTDYLTAGLGAAALGRLFGYYGEGRLRALRGPEFTLDRAHDAQAALASRDTVGKVQILVDGASS